MSAQCQYDVIIVGGGHAGAEAAWAAAHLGARTALLTFRRDAIGRMSCNPAIGGIGKGQMVREIDALGGLMGIVADETGIQFRMLNRRKGPAVWAPRCQSDSAEYARAVQRHLAACPNLTIVEAGVEALRSEADGADGYTRRITGVELNDGRTLRAPAVILTSGTFLGALMHCGECQTPGGRIGEQAATGLSGALRALGLTLGRLKTGTPPRVARDSINFAALESQPGDDPPTPFSFLHDRIAQPQVECWLSYTNERIHALLRENLHRAPMYSGQIQSRGPRYCPSIEDKVVRFADKDRHQVFLEPEGRASDRIYINGVSTSLPQDVQAQLIAGIPGLENARVLQWGYAVEYDFVPPEQTAPTLMTKSIRGLFLAGQINGTSGYEEAAGQGLVAGVNAARFIAEQDPFILRRDQAYIGVMIDDLVTRELTEPYRMFTSRAENRLHLRYDNADQRLTALGRSLGLVDDRRWARFEAKESRRAELRNLLGAIRLDGKSLADLLKRPDEEGGGWAAAYPALAPYLADADVWGSVMVEIKYAGYLARQERAIAENAQAEAQELPPDLDFSQIPHLRREAVEKLGLVRPRSLGQAGRVPGVHPTDISLLRIYLASMQRVIR